MHPAGMEALSLTQSISLHLDWLIQQHWPAAVGTKITTGYKQRQLPQIVPFTAHSNGKFTVAVQH